MYKKHKWFSGLRKFGALNQLRQICDLTGCFKILNLCQNANLAQYNLTDKFFEITYVSYTYRYASFWANDMQDTVNEIYQKYI